MKPRKSEIDFMAPKVGALRTTGHPFAVMTLAVIVSLLVVFLLWASIFEIDVVTRGVGQIIPSQKTQVVSHFEGGTIQKVFVKEGDVVEAGQPLIALDPLVAQSKYKTNREQYYRYLAASERLQAQLDGKDYQVPEIIQKEAPLVASEEMERYLERKRQVETQKAIAEEVVLQKAQIIEEDKANLDQAKDQLVFAEQELEMVGPLVKEELISKREVLRLKRDIATLKGDIAKGKASLPKDQAALKQAQHELEQVLNNFNNEDQEKLREVEIKLAEEQGEFRESADLLKRTILRAPVKGIVKEIKVKTVGSAIRSGEEIMNVVPYEDTLLVEAKVLPADVAFTHPGQLASIKITAYDYSIYGSIDGKLLKISADTVYDEEQKHSYYKVLLQTDKNYLEYKGSKLPIIPGMTTQVDILTGKRTVLMYILKPILRGVKESFQER
jgi:adhesin transport system membrane fusion protein